MEIKNSSRSARNNPRLVIEDSRSTHLDANGLNIKGSMRLKSENALKTRRNKKQVLAKTKHPQMSREAL